MLAVVRKWILILVIGISMGGCFSCAPHRTFTSFTIPTIEGGRGFKTKDMCDGFIKSGIFKDYTDLMKIPFTFAVVDSLGNPCPFGNIILKFEDSTRVINTDNRGETKFYFDIETIELNPTIMAEDRAQRLKFGFTFATPLDTLEKREFQLVNLSELNRLEAEKDIVYYPAGYEELSLQIKKYIPVMRIIIEERIGFAPEPFGIVITNEKEPILLPQNWVIEEGTEYNLFAFSIYDKEFARIYLSIVHEWTEITLNNNIKFGDDKVRWITDGIAEYVSYSFARRLTHDQRGETGISDDIKKELNNYERYVDEQIRNGEKIIKFNLLDWPLTSPTYPLPTKEADMLKLGLGYALAHYFWYGIEEDFGGKAIPEFIDRISKVESPTGKECAGILTELTEDNILKRLKTFPLVNLKKAIKSVREKLDS